MANTHKNHRDHQTYWNRESRRYGGEGSQVNQVQDPPSRYEPVASDVVVPDGSVIETMSNKSEQDAVGAAKGIRMADEEHTMVSMVIAATD